MSDQFPLAHDPYSSGGEVPGSGYFPPDSTDPDEFSSFFTQDFLPLDDPTSSGYSASAFPHQFPTGPTNPLASLPQPYSLQQYNDIEEEKRRRNTAASARFRVKKKEREKNLEKQAQEVEERVRGLEGRVQMLERENGWLRGLVVEKKRNLQSTVTRADDGQREDVASGRRKSKIRMQEKDTDWRAHGQEEDEREDRVVRSPRKRNDGVGTRH